MRRASHAAAALGTFWLLGCQTWSDDGAGRPRQALRAEADATADAAIRCVRPDLGAVAPLAGVPSRVRDAVLAGARDGLVIVRYAEQAHCGVSLDVLEGCRAPGRYAYVAAPEARSELVHDVGAGAPALLLAATSLRRAAAGTPARVDHHRVGRLRAPRTLRLDVDGLVGRACDGATHVVQQIDLGGYAVTSGSLPALQNARTYFRRRPPNGPDGRRLLIEGNPAACRRAVRSRKRTEGCGVPLAIALLPITTPQKAEVRDVFVTAGQVRVGAPADENATPPVAVEAFRIDRHEVTAAEYAACVAQRACKPAGEGERCTGGRLGRERHPINCVTWFQAATYCKFAGGRLPSEAEWERAARGADGRPFPWGHAWPPPDGVANLADLTARSSAPYWRTLDAFVDGFPTTAPVGSFAANAGPSDVLDMAGNVREWTADWYVPAKGPRKKARVVKGSSFGHARREDVVLTQRAYYVPSTQSAHIGFRCATSSS